MNEEQIKAIVAKAGEEIQAKYDALKSELTADPRTLGYVAEDLPGKRALINANPETISRAISPATLWGYLFDHSRLVAVGAARTDAGLSSEQQKCLLNHTQLLMVLSSVTSPKPLRQL